MSDESLDTTAGTESPANQAEVQVPAVKTYTQEEFDRHMAGLKSSLSKKFEKQFADLGDIEELRALKAQAEQRRTDEALKKGEFERVLQELAAKKDAEIVQRDSIIREFKVDTPLLNAAAKYRSVNPEQVKALLRNSVRLNSDGEVEVLDDSGSVRYNDQGRPVPVEDFVREWLDQNPHFVQPTPATSAAKSGISNDRSELDPTKLDLTDPKQRAVYAEWRKQNYNSVRRMQG